MKILITGGAGYIGTELSYELAKNPTINSIVVYDNMSRRNFNFFFDKRYHDNKISFIEGELLDSRKLKAALEDVDVVYHLAAKVNSSQKTEDSHYYDQINNWGTAELVNAIEDSNVQHVIYLSSINVYGYSDHDLDIDSEPDPRDGYGYSKLRGEAQIQRLHGKIRTHIIRCSQVFGFGTTMRFDQMLNKFMFNANFSNRIQVRGSGEHKRSVVHINKLINVLHNLIVNKTFDSGIYNLVGKNLSINEMIELLKELYPKLETIYMNQNLLFPGLSVKHDQRIDELITMTPQSIQEDLRKFKDKFAFSPDNWHYQI